MDDINARLKHMDELDIDVQVLYPTIFLRPFTRRPELELAVTGATTAGSSISGSAPGAAALGGGVAAAVDG